MIRQRPQWAKCTTGFTDRLMHHNRCKAHAKSHCMGSQCRWRANVEAHKQNMHTNSKSKCGNAQAEKCTNVEAGVTKVKHINTKELKTQKILFTCMQLTETATNAGALRMHVQAATTIRTVDGARLQPSHLML